MQERRRIDNVKGSFMIATALLFDGIQALLTVLLIGILFNWLVTIIAWLTFYIWFKLQGVSFADGSQRKLATFLGSALVEILPGINALPTWTLMVVLTLAIVKREDALYNKSRGRLSAPLGNRAQYLLS